MPDEVVTEATRPETPSVDDSLFGEAAEDKPAPVVEEEDSKDQTQQGSDDAGEQDAKTEAAEDEKGDDEGEQQANASEDLKVVVSIKGDRATIGVQKPSADPYIETFDDQDLSRLAQKVAEVNERAQARWEEGPKHPAYRRPVPAPTRRNRSPQAATNVEGESQPQPMTLRLF